ncbi:MAG: SAM-dependent methyltransferase [Halioglobus sp.]|nr:SAM-dependent methyltransferase [Halioglobus sp.]
MQTDSRYVRTNQQGPHERLAEVVRRHLQHPDQTPLQSDSRAAYRELVKARLGRPLVIDAFCGTGHSTAVLAQRHPHHLVVGIDQSAHRLGRHIPGPNDNYLLLRARCEDIWCLLVEAGQAVEYHYILYPNPWPKSSQLQRRVHGHASFPLLAALGGRLELRSNWRLYVEEFALAMQLAGHAGQINAVASDGADISLFEAKYRKSGHDLWRFEANLA